MELRALVVCLVLLTGCPGTLVERVTLPRYQVYDPATIEELVDPEPVVVGDVVELDGYILSAADWKKVLRDRERMAEGLHEAQLQVEFLAVKAEDIIYDRGVALMECRKANNRHFAMGVGVGAGACSVIYGALDRLPAP